MVTIIRHHHGREMDYPRGGGFSMKKGDLGFGSGM